MKHALILVALILTSARFIDAQTLESCSNDGVLLEAYYIGVGMSGIQGKRLIARICKDRKVFFEDVATKAGRSQFYLRSKLLSESEFAAVFKRLSEVDTTALNKNYPALTSTIDHSEDLVLRISTPTDQEIHVTNFKPDMPNAIEKYPIPLLRIACISNAVRTGATMTFFFRESQYCRCLE